MKANMGTADRLLRILAAGIILVLYYAGVLSGTAALVLLAVAGIFLLTSFLRICPAYLPFGIRTLGRKESRQ